MSKTMKAHPQHQSTRRGDIPSSSTQPGTSTKSRASRLDPSTATMQLTTAMLRIASASLPKSQPSSKQEWSWPRVSIRVSHLHSLHQSFHWSSKPLLHWIIDMISSNIRPDVQEILRRVNLSANDLLQLPRPSWFDLRQSVVYASIVMPVKQGAKKPGLYIGSSVQKAVVTVALAFVPERRRGAHQMTSTLFRRRRRTAIWRLACPKKRLWTFGALR